MKELREILLWIRKMELIVFFTLIVLIPVGYGLIWLGGQVFQQVKAEALEAMGMGTEAEATATLPPGWGALPPLKETGGAAPGPETTPTRATVEDETTVAQNQTVTALAPTIAVIEATSYALDMEAKQTLPEHCSYTVVGPVGALQEFNRSFLNVKLVSLQVWAERGAVRATHMPPDQANEPVDLPIYGPDVPGFVPSPGHWLYEAVDNPDARLIVCREYEAE